MVPAEYNDVEMSQKSSRPEFSVVTFGEAMLRLSPPHFRRLEQATSFDACVGGAELNVAVALSRLGVKSRWVSRLPENPLGRLVANTARFHGVDVSHIVWTEGGRVGLYFMEFGASPRASSVLYDRSHSAVSEIRAGEVDWESAFSGASLFHTSGITPALSRSSAEATTEALKIAKEMELKVSYDLNYRSRLWSQEEARKTQEPLMEFVDVLLTTEEDTERVFGIKGSSYAEVAEKLAERFEFDAVAITIRENISVWKNNWTAIVYTEGKVLTDVKYEVEIVDRVGAGDSFTAGFLYGYLSGDRVYGLRLGNALSALKHSILGDLNFATLEEADELIKGGGLRIKR